MKIEFVAYDGEYPNLCSGQLILRIDGVIHGFGRSWYNKADPKKQLTEENLHDKFWSTGGNAGVDGDGDEFCFQGDWQFDKDRLPDFLKPYSKEIFKLFQANVPSGCCGGCI